MGLDMYLTKKTYVQNWDHTPEENKHYVSVVKGDGNSHVKPERVTYITEEIAYWRKFNALHKWFVDNVQDGNDDCNEYWLSKDTLQSLLDLLLDVRTTGNAELLPPTEGFFFGSTEIDDWYWSSVDETINTLKDILAEEDPSPDFYYQSSW